MSGPIFKFSRRYLLQASVSAGALAAAGLFWKKSQTVLPTSQVDENSASGHVVRDAFRPGKSVSERHIDTVIVGSGVSGLSTAYFLEKKDNQNYIILEADARIGGNSAHEKNDISSYPLGAHYLPVPRNEDTLLLDFLKEIGVITGYQNKLPVYNEEYLCHVPLERLLIKGRWQEGIIPTYSASEKDLSQIKEFLAYVDQLRRLRGRDGKSIFAIPVEDSSQDAEWLALDKISFTDFIKQKNWQNDYLKWYLNYCCRDDFGLEAHLTSAWAGLHYFSSRSGLAANTEAQSVLTWPQGNGFLVEQILKKLSQNVQTRCAARMTVKEKDHYLVYYTDHENQQHLLRCKKLVYAIPKSVIKHIHPGMSFPMQAESHPWIVANMTVKKKILEERLELCWDNVLFGSASLGYVNACHQLLSQGEDDVNITFYHAFSDGDAKTLRQRLAKMTEQELTQSVFSELKKMHPQIEINTSHITVKLWGHGMVAPKVNYIWNDRLLINKAEDKNIIFAHTERAGISIFEEAFHQGHKAAARI